MKIRILKDFSQVTRIAGVKLNTLKTLLEENQDKIGIVNIDGTKPLGCVKIRYQMKCKSSNCFLIQGEAGLKDIQHNACHKCHLRFLELYEQGKIKLKNN